jgi:hypothetical protein
LKRLLGLGAALAIILGFCLQRSAPAQVALGPSTVTFNNPSSANTICNVTSQNSGSFYAVGTMGPIDAYVSTDGNTWTQTSISTVNGGVVQAQPFTPSTGVNYQVGLQGSCVKIAADSTYGSSVMTVTLRAQGSIGGTLANNIASPIPGPTGTTAPSSAAVFVSSAGVPLLPIACNTVVPINISTATTTVLVGNVAGAKVHVCLWNIQIVSGTTPTFFFETGGTGACTGPTALTGTYSGITLGQVFGAGEGLGQVMQSTGANSSWCIVTGGTAPNLQGYAMVGQY